MKVNWNTIEKDTEYSTVSLHQYAKPFDYLQVLGERGKSESTTSNQPHFSFGDHEGNTQSKTGNADDFDTLTKHQNVLEKIIKFLEDVIKHPQATITQHYNNIGIKGTPANRLKDQLLERDLIGIRKGTSSSSRGGAPPKYIYLTNKGKEFYEKFKNDPRQ